LLLGYNFPPGNFQEHSGSLLSKFDNVFSELFSFNPATDRKPRLKGFEKLATIQSCKMSGTNCNLHFLRFRAPAHG
jgi:hypothetical protein